jgi:hypothetical protein
MDRNLRQTRHPIVSAMHRYDRGRVCSLVVFYTTLALAWLAFSRWLATPYMAMESPGQPWSTLQRLVRPLPSVVLTRDIPGAWRELSTAVLIAMLLHFTIVLILRGYDQDSGRIRTPSDARAQRRSSLWLALLSFAFLAVAALSGLIHDYFFYLQMWHEVRAGSDPWFIVFGVNGAVPLNAYGPLFNTMAGLPSVNPRLPKLLFAYAYLLFVIVQIKTFTANRPASLVQSVALTATFWNPYPWVEIAFLGHFDILVALLCLGSVNAWARRRDTASAILLASGVLLKFLPIVLLPFLAFDRGRFRARFVAVAVALIGAGFGASFMVWGSSTLAPITFAATRRSVELSIFAFIRGRFSPLRYFFGARNYDEFTPLVMFLAFLREWFWYRRKQPNIEATAAVVVMTMVVLHRTGYPQYHIVPFVLGISWALQYWTVLERRPGSVIAIGSYFTWLAVFDVYNALTGDGNPVWYWNEARDLIGLPAFLFGCAFIAGVIRASDNPDRKSDDSTTI